MDIAREVCNINKEPPEEEIRDLAKRLIWILTSDYKRTKYFVDPNPHFNEGFVSLINYLSSVVCDDWPAGDLKGFSEELEHFNFIRYIPGNHSRELFQRFAEICAAASGKNNIEALMTSSEEIEVWPTLIEYRTIGLTRNFLRYPQGWIERYAAKGQLFLNRNQ